MAQQVQNGVPQAKKTKNDEHSSVTLFRDYLRVKTVQPEPDYDSAVIFLSKVAKDIGLEFLTFEVHHKNPVAILTWLGTDPSLPSLMLNSHIDVVPVYPECWKYDPFAAEKDEHGNIYARGAQDMKCVGIQYVEAVRRLKQDGKRYPRTIHLTFVPDEEVGGMLGMAKLLEHEHFKKLNVGFALDEGLASTGDEFKVYYGERSVWWLKFKCTGNPGHGSRFIKDTAAEKVQKLMQQVLEFRKNEEARLEADPNLSLGDVTTANINIIQGGVQMNVVPSDITVGVDFRVAPTVDLKAFMKEIESWIEKAGGGITYEFVQRADNSVLTSTSPEDPWWNAFSSSCEKLGIKIKTEIFPAGTDSRYLRNLGLPAIGFSPMNHTPILLHDHDEYLNEDIFLKGIEYYCEIIPSLANVTV